MPSATAAWSAATIPPRAPSTPVAAGSSRDAPPSSTGSQAGAAGGLVDRRGRPRVAGRAGEVADRLAQGDGARVIGAGDRLAGSEQAGGDEPLVQALGRGEIVGAVLEVDRVHEPLDEPQRARGGRAATWLGSHTIKIHLPV